MAKEFARIESFLEKNGKIEVKKYWREKYKKSDTRNIKCSNCDVLNNHAHLYSLLNDELADICFVCNKKIHNINSSNPAFRKI